MEIGKLTWAWQPAKEAYRYWLTTINDRTILLPAEISPLGLVPHDGVYRDGKLFDKAYKTLVVACCTPVIGMVTDTFGLRLFGQSFFIVQAVKS